MPLDDPFSEHKSIGEEDKEESEAKGAEARESVEENPDYPHLPV